STTGIAFSHGLARPAGLEPATTGLEGRCSIRLSYGRPGGATGRMVGAEGFEPPTLWSQTRCATRLRYAPIRASVARQRRERPVILGTPAAAVNPCRAAALQYRAGGWTGPACMLRARLRSGQVRPGADATPTSTTTSTQGNRMIRSGNPALKESSFLDLGSGAIVRGDQGAMTLNGTVNKIGLLLLMAAATATFAGSQVSTPAGIVGAGPYLWGGAIGGLVLALVTVFRKQWAPVTAPMYALVEGLFLGAISAMFNHLYEGIVMQAVLLTFGTLFALLLAYRSGLVRATENFKLGVVAATGGVMLVYLASIVLGLFGINMPMIHESGIVGIGFSLVVVVIAALNLVLDFDFIESGVEQG